MLGMLGVLWVHDMREIKLKTDTGDENDPSAHPQRRKTHECLTSVSGEMNTTIPRIKRLKKRESLGPKGWRAFATHAHIPEDAVKSD